MTSSIKWQLQVQNWKVESFKPRQPDVMNPSLASRGDCFRCLVDVTDFWCCKSRKSPQCLKAMGMFPWECCLSTLWGRGLDNCCIRLYNMWNSDWHSEDRRGGSGFLYFCGAKLAGFHTPSLSNKLRSFLSRTHLSRGAQKAITLLKNNLIHTLANPILTRSAFELVGLFSCPILTVYKHGTQNSRQISKSLWVPNLHRRYDWGPCHVARTTASSRTCQHKHVPTISRWHHRVPLPASWALGKIAASTARTKDAPVP